MKSPRLAQLYRYALSVAPQPFSIVDLAEAEQLDKKLASSLVWNCCTLGKLQPTAPRSGLYQFTHEGSQAAQKWAAANQEQLHNPSATAPVKPAQLARLAARHMRNGAMRSSYELATLCNAGLPAIDAALAPLVDAHKLIRVAVQRLGVEMFDYRYSSTWVPCDADFAFCGSDRAAPKASISPVAPPAPRPEPSAPAPASKAPAAAPPPTAKPRAAAASQQPQSLGWAAALETQGEAPAAIEVITGPMELEARDLVCALNSRGELVLDLGDEILVRFKPPQALLLTRFASVSGRYLEQLAQRGEL